MGDRRITAMGGTAGSPTGGLLHGASEPHRVPERIVANATHEPRTHGIGHDIASSRHQILIATQGVVMKGSCPQPAVPLQAAVGGARHDELQPMHRAIQRLGCSKLQERVEVIGHQHPAWNPVIGRQIELGNSLRSSTADDEMLESRNPVLCNEGEQINLARHTDASLAQPSMSL